MRKSHKKQEKNEEEYKNALDFFNSSSLYSPCNMFIMRKKDFDNYCKWLFPLLSRIDEKINNTLKDNYQNRYIGFMAERLFTLYVLYNNFKIYESNVIFENSIEKHSEFKNLINNNIFVIKKIGR